MRGTVPPASVFWTGVTWRLHGSDPDEERTFDLSPPGPATIGRALGQTIRLAPRLVSREHAELHWVVAMHGEPEHWRLRDKHSSGGVFLNGVRLAPGGEVRLEHGDLVEIRPWVFRVENATRRSSQPEPTLRVASQAGYSDAQMQEMVVRAPGELAQAHLLRLLEASEQIAAAADEGEIARAAVAALVAATGFTNVALLRPGAVEGTVESVACVGDIIDMAGAAKVSLSLLKRSRTAPYVLRGQLAAGATLAVSIASLNIDQAISVPVSAGDTFYGWLYLDNRQGSRSEAHEHEASGLAAAIARMAGMALSSISRLRMQQRFLEEQKEMFSGTVRALIATIDAKDPYTRGHSDRVSEFAALLAQAVQCEPDMVEQVRMCGLVHDIGKIGVPEEILRKPARLTDAEFDRIKEHPAIGHRILRDISQMRDLLPGVLEHHERWDGRGYPGGLAGDTISRLGRIICIADCFDAMTSARFYRPARPVGEVLEEIRRCLGTHFDPELGAAFLLIPVAQLEALIAPPVMPGLVSEAVARS